MNRTGRYLILAVICVALGGVIYKVAENLWLQKVMEIKQDPTRLLDVIPEAALQLKDFRRSKVERGQKVWEVTGDEAVYMKENKEAIIKTPKLTFYHENGEPIEVRGEQGFLNFAGREIETIRLVGNVEVLYQGFVLKTDELVYNQKKDQVVSEGKVAMTGDGLQLEGQGAEISLKDQTIRLRDRVKTRIEPNLLEGRKIQTG